MLHHQAGVAGEIEHNAHEAVDGDFRHDAAHQGGDVARSSRMGERQPNMQRHEAGLRARANECKDQGQRAERRGRMRGAHLRKHIMAIWASKQAERE